MIHPIPITYIIFCPRGCQRLERTLVNHAVLERWIASKCTYCEECRLDAYEKPWTPKPKLKPPSP